MSFETSLNVNAMYYGLNSQLSTEAGYVFHDFKNNGYVIGSFANECQFDAMGQDDNFTYSEPFVQFDNYGGSYACDMNYDSALQMDIVLDKGRNSVFRRCMYGQDIHNIQLEYIKQFWDKYQGNRKAFRSKFNENHEATGELIGYNDKDTVKFFEYFEEKGYLKDTIVYFISDHGQHFVVGHLPFIPDDSRISENYLPLLIMLVPSDIPEKNMKMLKNNQQHFLNSFDVYSSFKSIAAGQKQSDLKNLGHSFINEDLPLYRD